MFSDSIANWLVL